MQQNCFVLGLVSMSSFYRFLIPFFDVWDFQIVVSAKNVLQHRFLMEIVFSEFRDACLSFFRRLGNRFSDFLGLEDRFENRGIFGDATDPEFGIWGRRSTRYLGRLMT